jgi:acetylornithine/succinyldiaminopimelate/putrescine aminotransferase
VSDPGPDKPAILALAARHVCPGRLRTFEAAGTVPVMGRRLGNHFWDLDGRRLFDCHLNGGVFNLGHRHPEVVAALHAAIEHYDIGNHHLPSGPRAWLAEALVRCAPGSLRYAVFAAGGGEAVDVAIRSARRATGRRRIVSIQGGYHGHTGLAIQAGDVDQARYFLSDAPAGEFAHVPWNDLDALRAALAPGDVAAVLLETIPATLGFPLPAPGYLAGVKALCEAHDALYVADEVQTGLGRTGPLWAVEAHGVAPDVLVTGKGLSGGMYPIAAALLSERAGAWLGDNGWGHVSTFGGAEIGCEVARAVLDVVTRPAVVANARAMALRLGERLAAIQARHPFLAEVRQSGLVIGLRFAHPLGGPLVMASAFEVGLWAFAAGFDRSVLQFKPSLLVDAEACDEATGLLEEAIARCVRKHGL